MKENLSRNIDPLTGKPFRHGWGGDRKKRARALNEQREEAEERLINREKYGEGDCDAHIFDEDFFKKQRNS